MPARRRRAAALSLSDVRPILEATKTVAVLGCSTKPAKAGYYVPAYLQRVGYRVFPVNPAYAGTEILGEPVHATLAELTEPIDMVDVFRRPDQIPGHLDDILAMDPLPKVVWFQLGIRNDEAAAVLREAGITVVQSRCTLADHRALGL